MAESPHIALENAFAQSPGIQLRNRDKAALDFVLNCFESPVFKQLDENGYSPLLKVVCRLADTWIKKGAVTLKRERTEGAHLTFNHDIPDWIGEATFRAQLLDRRENVQEVEDAFKQIRTALEYDYLEYLKKANGNQSVNIALQLESASTPKANGKHGITKEGVLKRIAWVQELGLGEFDGRHYLIFDIDTEGLARIFKKASGLSTVIK